MKQVALSGVQTTGVLHIGNYIGSIKNWVNMQEDYQCYFFLADLHALTIPRPASELKEARIHVASMYLAAGLDPKKCTIFAQSAVHQHCELAWILNCMAPVGWLKRMTQFKDKAGKKADNASTGLFTYPVLMAADILLYNADIVPVGEDQTQHLELARDLCGVINRKFATDQIKMPEALITKTGRRIMSLRDGTSKMSKSDNSDAGRINLTDSDDQIISKLRKSKTDSLDYISYDKENRPDISNLIDLFSIFSEKSSLEIADEYATSGFAKFKSDLAELLCHSISPIRKQYNDLRQNEDYVHQVLKQGAENAKIRAEQNLNIIKKGMGLL